MTYKCDYFSASSLGLYVDCPWKYEDVYLKKNFAHSYSDRTEVGNVVHAALEKFFNRHTYGSEMRSVDELLQIYEDCRNESGLRDEATYLEGRGLIVSYYKRKLAGKRSYCIETEKKFSIDMGNGLTIAGKIDRIDKLPDGKIVVVDYKTGSWFSSTEELEEAVQFNMYAVAIAKLNPGFDIANLLIVVDYIKLLEDRPPMTKTPEDIVNFIKYLFETQKQISSIETFPQRANDFCGNCHLRKKCKLWLDAIEGDEIFEMAEEKDFVKLYGLKKLCQQKQKMLKSRIEEIDQIFKNHLGKGEEIVIGNQELVLANYHSSWYPGIETKKILEEAGLWEDRYIGLRSEDMQLIGISFPEVGKKLEAVKKISVGNPNLKERKRGK